jgi:hypothetical protein
MRLEFPLNAMVMCNLEMPQVPFYVVWMTLNVVNDFWTFVGP